MNTYACFLNGKQIEVEAETTYAAQTAAAGIFRAKRQSGIDVYLVAIGETPYVHTASN